MDESLLSLGQAAKLLGVRASVARDMAQRGELRPVRVDVRSGRPWFRREDVEAVASKLTPASAAATVLEPTAEQCSEAFEMMRNGSTLADIVQKVKVTPQQARRLYDEYRTPLGANPESHSATHHPSSGSEDKRRAAEAKAARASSSDEDRMIRRQFQEVDEARNGLIARLRGLK